MKSLTFSFLICALNLYFAQKLLKKDKICSRLLELQKIAPNAKSCSKVAEHNRERPTYDVKLPNSTSYGERGYVTQEFCFSFPNLDAVLENLTPGKFVNTWKTEEMKWKLEVWNSANSLSSVAFSLPKGLDSNLGGDLLTSEKPVPSSNTVGPNRIEKRCAKLLSSFSLLSSRRFSIVCFITARSPFFARLHRPRACHMLTY